MSKRFKHLELRQVQEQAQEGVGEVSGTPVRTAEDDMRLAVEANRLGRFERALQMYTRALREQRGLIPAWVGQVQMLVELDEFAEARLWSDKALEIFRDNGELLAAKAQACARLGDRRAAFACSDASMQSPGSSPLRWQARGEVLLASDRRRARDCFEKSLAEPQADWFDRLVVARIHLFYRRAAAAMEFAQAAVKLKPAHVYCWYVLGQAQEAMAWPAEAQESYQRCAELSADFPEARAALEAIVGRPVSWTLRRWIGRWFRR